jgi:PAS domain S-box-containing protein
MNLDHSVLQEAPDAIVVMAPDGSVVHWNKGAEVVFGYRSEEALGCLLSAMLIPADRIDEDRMCREYLIQTGACSYESIRRKKDGSFVYVDISSKAIYDTEGEIQCILTSQKDVTSLKVLRDAQLLETKFRNLLESMPDGIVMINSTGHIVLANTQIEKLFGYEAGELRGKPIGTLLPSRFHSGHGEYPSHYFGLARTCPRGTRLELYGLHKDGMEFPVEISLSPLETEEGILVSGAIRDISERKRIEHTLHEKNIQLENANLAKDRFLVSMSHELRTPLNAVIGFTGTLLMRLPGPLTTDQEKQLKTVQASAKYLLSLINDLLDLAKIESGKVELHFEPMIGQKILANLKDTLLPLATIKGLNFTMELPNKEITIITDRRALSQILINLANNAIKFTEQGEVRIGLSEHEQAGQRMVNITVTDTGIGIKTEEQSKLFQAFSQLDLNSRCFEGTGLGLYLSQKLAGLIDAKLSFHSTYGEGSSFTLSLKGDKQ